jgi:Fe(3+) dicitrate transport protein
MEVLLLKLADQRKNNVECKIFNSLGYDNAIYTSASINNGGVLKEINGNYVANAPVWTEKCGTDFRYKTISTGIQFNYTSKSYNDALNTVSGSNGVTGMIPAYHVWDWNIKWQMAKQYFISAAINNVTDEQYFNRLSHSILALVFTC